MVRRMDRQEEVLIWCSKCSGYARQRMGPKLMNLCNSEQVGTKGALASRIQALLLQAAGRAMCACVLAWYFRAR